MKTASNLPLCQMPRGFVDHVAGFLDMQGFGNAHVYADGHADDDVQTAQPDLDAHPYLLHREDYDAIRAMHRNMIEALKDGYSCEKHTPDENQCRFATEVGFCTASKVLVLVQAMLICHNYYNVPTERYPGFKPSSLLDAQINPDFLFALRCAKKFLIDKPGKHADVKAARLRDIYAVAKILFDLLTGWLPCAEVDELRNAYTLFHTTPDGGEALDRVAACLQALSVRFSKAEPEWERARAGLADNAKQPLVPHVDDFQKAGGALYRKKNRRGSDLKGPKTATMAKQLKDFKEWINNGHEIDESHNDKTIGARASQYWQKNKSSMDRASSASGEKRGYKNAKCLADAYRKR